MLRNGLEPWHLLVVLAVVILLFGSKKLPEMARGLGKSMRILKAETAAMREDGPAAEQAPEPVTPVAPVTPGAAGPPVAPVPPVAPATATTAGPEGRARPGRPA
ncbi:Sec-independent protein translocase subunit TatA [Kitasatospora sp. NPDC089913]|uniref:Sec-independent protein translocase subunit TatA n=1 Tax=Streptomycetaceae TaxID=2062 RepID=UPI00087AA802|nr:Sec-independent protein translocase subunit TatA [Streptomyces sp. TLI_053]SDT10535.1 sec-independent protein translocase protein TatA [Streptomyces sp. TLI_053]